MAEETVGSAAETTSISEERIVEAATNDPALSPDEFRLGDARFKLVYLPYDDYLSFLTYLRPFMEMIAGAVSKKRNVSVPGIDLGPAPAFDMDNLIRFCGNSLPEMVRLVCKQTAPDITVEQIKEGGKNPFVLASIVIRQVAKNQMIKDFADFFAQMTPLLQ